ncbi:MAG TPA: bifunctional riboflavin kinase/FAD synthetase [Gammaproteobacteria bacterium]|nr:bifunctional riboflavin kinase/FAD synthetase [Gammaproteobacteria bacterium]
MELIRGYHNLRGHHRGSAVTIGNFDGVHLGHQAVLGQLSEKAAELGLPTVVVTFEPHPQEYFGGDKAPPRLTRFREKIQTLRRYAVDRVLVLRFDDRLARMPAEAFIERILVAGLGVRYLVVGDDFRFGHRRRGDIELLRAAGQQHGFQVVNMHTFEIDGARVSSTRIRKALEAGALGTAEKLLGRCYRISGRVARGDRRGRTLGFPTANIHVHGPGGMRTCVPARLPLHGVYAVDVYGLEDEPHRGVANIGSRPTVDGRRCILEVHLLDFSGDLYDRHLQVEFLKKLRDERGFGSLEALREQIRQDVAQARDFFSGERRPVDPAALSL